MNYITRHSILGTMIVAVLTVCTLRNCYPTPLKTYAHTYTWQNITTPSTRASNQQWYFSFILKYSCSFSFVL